MQYSGDYCFPLFVFYSLSLDSARRAAELGVGEQAYLMTDACVHDKHLGGRCSPVLNFLMYPVPQ
jgi:hypothetical protein